MTLPRLGAANLALMIACAAPVLSQTLPTRALGRPDVEYSEAFTTISGVRELRDGRLIVADAREMRLELIDLRTGGVTKISRQGAGPGEYGILTRLHALPGDSTLMYDAQNDRYLLISGTGVVSTPLFELAHGTRFSESPIGVDHHGGVYYTARTYPPGERRMNDQPTATLVMRYDRGTKRIDTLATLAIPTDRFSGARDLGGGMLQMFDNRPLAPEDVAAPAPDGRLAVVRAKQFRVEWIGRDGRPALGPVIAHEAIRITDDEKRAHLRSQIRPGSIIVRPPVGGEGKAAPIRSSNTPPIPRTPVVDIDDPSITWPATKPPFLAGAARVAPDGLLWLQRARRHDDPRTTFDLFDNAGRRIARVVLPPDTRLVGFGPGTVWLARRDADDLEWLQRHRM